VPILTSEQYLPRKTHALPSERVRQIGQMSYTIGGREWKVNMNLYVGILDDFSQFVIFFE